MTVPTQKTGFYADFNALAALKRDAKADSGKALRATAQQFESLFTEMMLKSMRAANVGDSLTGSDTMDFYTGMFDQQLAMQMSKGKGLGLADMLVQQLTRSGLVSNSASASAASSASPASSSTASISAPTNNMTASPSMLSPDVAASLKAIMMQSDTPFAHIDEFGAPEFEMLDPQRIDAATATSETSSAWPPATPEAFVRQLLPQAQQAAAQLGVDAETLIAHAALETGWGKHVPDQGEGRSSFNLFGIKATPNWSGNTVAATTIEYEQGIATRRVERFKAYDSPADCFADYANLLGRRYQGVTQAGSNAGQFANALQQGGYATDPHYAAKLSAVAQAVSSVMRSAQVHSLPADT